jgi:hypothetical protein
VIEGLLAPLLEKLEKSPLPLPPYDYEWWLGRKHGSYSASHYNLIWESSKLPADMVKEYITPNKRVSLFPTKAKMDAKKGLKVEKPRKARLQPIDEVEDPQKLCGGSDSEQSDEDAVLDSGKKADISMTLKAVSKSQKANKQKAVKVKKAKVKPLVKSETSNISKSIVKSKFSHPRPVFKNITKFVKKD